MDPMEAIRLEYGEESEMYKNLQRVTRRQTQRKKRKSRKVNLNQPLPEAKSETQPDSSSNETLPETPKPVWQPPSQKEPTIVAEESGATLIPVDQVEEAMKPHLEDLQGTGKPLTEEKMKDILEELESLPPSPLETLPLASGFLGDKPPSETISHPLMEQQEESVPVKIDPNAETEDEILCRRVREWCGPHAVAMAMKYMCERAPEVFPRFTMWKIEEKEPAKLVHKKIMSDGYVEEILPIIKLMVGDSIKNIQWTGRVVIGIAVYDTLRDLV
jgi:hypothetical protein